MSVLVASPTTMRSDKNGIDSNGHNEVVPRIEIVSEPGMAVVNL